MGEMDTQNKNEDAINEMLFGDDAKYREDLGFIKTKPKNGKGLEDVWKSEVDKMLNDAKTKEDFGAIGLKINYAIDNNLNVNYTDYQIRAGMKEAEIKRNKN